MLFIRDSAAGIEVFMVVRSALVDFAPNAIVFPGGKVVPSDAALADLSPGGQHLSPFHRSHAVAALREAFEEAGLLLAHLPDGSPVPENHVRGLDPLRSAIDKGSHSFADMLTSEGLTLALDGIHRFAHIITPKDSPKRFDTHFYIARAPAAHDAVIDMSEVVHGFWVPMSKALHPFESRFALMRPTRMVLGRLARYADVDSALADAASYDPPEIEPTFEVRDGKMGLATPDVRGFPAEWELMDAAWATSVGKK